VKENSGEVGRAVPSAPGSAPAGDAARWGQRALPDNIKSEEELDEVLTRPSAALREFIRTVSSPLLILGAGGKMGPTLAVRAKRAAEVEKHPLEVIAVSRFSDRKARQWLELQNIKTIACDLLDAAALRKVPEAANIIYLAGLKFGTAENPSATWAMNTIVPARVMERYAGARIVALSTGNVYPLTPTTRGGSTETDLLTPVGEYANAAVARERIFEFYSRQNKTPVALLRLFYAVELRYGLLVDIGRKVYGGEPIELANGFFNCIWQGDANDMAIRALSLASAPPGAWNLCRPEVFSVKAVASKLGDLLGRAPKISGVEAPTALFGNSAEVCTKLGTPSVPLDMMLPWIAHWVKQGGRNLAKPTHFEVRDGNY